MAQDNIFRVTATFQSPWSDIAQWVWHYKQIDPGGTLTLQLINAILAILQAVWGHIDSQIDQDWSGQTLDLALWDDNLKQFDTIRSVGIASLVGGAAGDGEPGNVSPFITFFTNKARSKGKKKLFGLVDSLVTNGALDASLVASMLLAASDWASDVTYSSIVHRPGNFNRATETFTEWSDTDWSVGAFTGSQYSRLPGRGA